MGIDAGFDMVPRLSKGDLDKQTWNRFIDSNEELYKDDDQVKINANYILFKAGEHPMLPLEGHKFLIFSSKISEGIAAATGVEDYIRTVARIARAHFGSRIRFWHEGSDHFSHYF